MNMWEMILLIAVVLAIVVSGLFIGVCLLISWATDTMRGRPRQEEQQRGYGGAPPAYPFRPYGRPDGRHRNASGLSAGPRRGGR